MSDDIKDEFAYKRVAGRLRHLGEKGKALVARLKRNETPAEERLWQLLRNDQILGLRFRRQHKIGPFIIDFFCIKCRLAVEADGSHHFYQMVEDEARTKWLETYGIRVLRFQNSEVLIRPDKVVSKIEKAIKDDPARHAMGVG